MNLSNFLPNEQVYSYGDLIPSAITHYKERKLSWNKISSKKEVNPKGLTICDATAQMLFKAKEDGAETTLCEIARLLHEKLGLGCFIV